jgi:hypothetical protein
MEIIRQMFVDILASGRRHKRCDDEIDVGEEEDNGDREGSFKGWRPLVWGSVEGEGVKVEMDKGSGYKDVYYCQGVRDNTASH